MLFKNNIVVKNILSLGIFQVANYVLPFISIPIISRIVGPEKFGVINLSSAFIGYFTLLIGYGFDLTATRKLASDAKNKEKRNKIFSETLQAQIILLLISIIIFIPILILVDDIRKEWKVYVYTFLSCFSLVITQNWLFQAMQDLSSVAIRNFVAKLIFIVLILICIRRQEDYEIYALALSISQIVTALISFIWSIRKYELQYIPVSFKESIELFSAEKTYFFTLIIINLYTSTNVVILGFMSDETQVGYYTAAQKIIIIIQTITALPLRQALFPFMNKKINENRKEGIQLAKEIITFIFWVGLVMSVLLLLFSKHTILYIYGNNFVSSVLAMQILAFVPLTIALTSVAGLNVMMNLNLDKVYFKITIVSAVFSLLTNLILVNKLGFVGSAISWAFTELLTFLLVIAYLKINKINIISLDVRPIIYRFKLLYRK